MAKSNDTSSTVVNATGTPLTNIKSSAPARPSELQETIEIYTLAAVAASYANDNIMPVMDSLRILSDFDHLDTGKLRIRIKLINDLAKVGLALVHDMACDMESQRDDLLAKVTALEGGAK